MRRAPNPTFVSAEKAEAAKPASGVREFADIRYTVLGKNSDAKLLSGRFQDKKLTELVRTVEGRDYLGSLWRIAQDDKVLRKCMTEVFDHV